MKLDMDLYKMTCEDLWSAHNKSEIQNNLYFDTFACVAVSNGNFYFYLNKYFQYSVHDWQTQTVQILNQEI